MMSKIQTTLVQRYSSEQQRLFFEEVPMDSDSDVTYLSRGFGEVALHGRHHCPLGGKSLGILKFKLGG
jgi:hypothetical protein